ncbi:MAG: 50S ribosomal protein L25 [Bacillota bacterium]|jgi:large subunit ribosomal protein L25
MGVYLLKAAPRAAGIKVNAVRREGFVPAVVYGAHSPAMAIIIPAKDLEGLLGAGAAARGLIDLEIGGSGQERKTVVLKQVQRHPVKGHVLHVDFHHISLKERMKTQVPVILHGEEELTHNGALVQHQVRSLDVECLPTEIPDSIIGDISGVEIGQQLRVADLPIPEGVKVLNDPEEIVVSVLASRREEEVQEAAEGAEAQEEAAE